VLFTEHAQNAETLHRFVHEAAAVNTIDDEHIVQVHDFGEERLPDGTLRAHCVMELLKGVSLLDEMWKEPLAVDRAVRIAQQTAMALDRAHAAGVLHRDIKPDNIFLQQKRDGDFVKILDFGVAKVIRQIADLPKSGTIKGVLLGTPEYMAPEQALGMDVDARADIYSLGLVLYEMLTGTPPFHADTFGKLLVQIANEPPPPLPLRSRSGEMIPRALAAVVMRCLEKKPEARWATAAEFSAALDPFAQTSTQYMAPSASDWAAIQAMRPKVGRMLMMGATLLALAAVAIWGLTRAAHADDFVSPDSSVTQPDTTAR
jgi:serine/threonine-protein kinase